MITVFNTLTKQKQSFVSIEKNKVKMYVCGVTVYDYCHIGHARAYVVFDSIRRFLEYSGYDVTYIQNFTDIDDKIIDRANESGTTYKALTEKFIEAFFQDLKDLNISKATKYPRATDYIFEMQDFIQALIQKGSAYPLDGDVYFAVESFKDYGKLSKKVLEDLQSGHRVDINQGKKNPMDFALWKKAKPGEPSWDSPWGQGRPGWHIECSVMAMKELGETIDIHAGGEDLVFPHHENEIAQSESLTGKPFANYWLHNGFVTINQEKMAKSKKNFFTISEILDEFKGEVLRFFLLRVQYRHPLNFTFDGLKEAKQALSKLHHTLNRFDYMRPSSFSEEEQLEIDEIKGSFFQALSDDFNFAEGLGILFDLSRWINSHGKGSDVLFELGQILGLFYQIADEEVDVPSEVITLAKARLQAKKDKDWARSDAIRDQIKDQYGFIVEDTPEGSRFKSI